MGKPSELFPLIWLLDLGSNQGSTDFQSKALSLGGCP